MARIPDAQIAGVAKAAGFTGKSLVTAVAVALAESGGNPSAVNRSNSNGTSDYGLWQINSVHADLLRTGSWSNPSDNARMAFSVWRAAGGSFSPWTTYTNGLHIAYLSRARVAVGNPASSAPFPGGGGGGVVTAGFPTLGGLGKLAGLVTDSHTWIRVSMFAVGVAVVWSAFLMVSKWDNTLRSGLKTVATKGLA